MNKDFKKKLQDYAEGKLDQEERAEVEQELEKLEQYQAFIEGQLTADQVGPMTKEVPSGIYSEKKQAAILRKAKWKARLQNAFTALGIILLVTIVCGLLTSLYYCSGKPSRMTIYDDVIASTIAITEPNLEFRSGGTSVKPFFGMEIKKDLTKQIGRAYANVGEMKISFLFNRCGIAERKWLLENNRKRFGLSTSIESIGAITAWPTLEKLPEGTVAEAYIYFDQAYPTDEVLQKFEGKQMQPVWFAVDTGIKSTEKRRHMIPIGFPYHPMWHDKDMTIQQQTEQKRGLFSKVVSRSVSSPIVESYGSADLRNRNFLDTLELLQNYEKIANTITGPHLYLKERIDYLDQHGIKIYGIVVTGPSKEILKLRDENWVTGAELGEVRLWNWEF